MAEGLLIKTAAIAAGMKHSISDRISGEKTKVTARENRDEEIKQELPSALYIDGKLYGNPGS